MFGVGAVATAKLPLEKGGTMLPPEGAVINAVSDGGGEAARAHDLSALSAATRYYGRVICNSLNADFDFSRSRSGVKR
jgi:hypothetical protein